MSDFIGIDVSGIEEIQAKLKKLPAEVIGAGIDEANVYLVNVLHEYPTYHHVSRKQAYPEVGGWFSDKQRRYVMGAIKRGEITIPYRRTQELAKNWRVYGKGIDSIIANETPGAAYVQGNSRTEQSRMSKMIGWKGIDVIIVERINRIVEKFDAGVKKAMRKLGL